MRTSYSAIETYLQCPQKYKLQEIDRIRVPKSREALFGTLIHDTLKFMFSRDPLFPTLDEVTAYFREHWPAREVFEKEAGHDPLKRSWSDEEEKIYFESGVRMLKKFYEKNAPWNYMVLDLESRFEVVLADNKTGESHILAGKIDRVDKLSDGQYEIIDYKTSKRMPSQEMLNRDLQLSLYSLGLQKRWPHINAEDIKLSLYFLKHGEKLSTKATTETTEKTKNHILKTIGEIQGRLSSGKEFEPMPGPLCDWCGYKPMCPAWRHLYRNKQQKTDNIQTILKEYFELKKASQQNENRIEELQKQIKTYMASSGLTRVFGEEGVLSQKTVQRYDYDWTKIRELLSPLGKWGEILKADEVKLRRVLKEIPEEIRLAVENSRTVSKEYVVLTASYQKIKKPEDNLPVEQF
ncbi:MAG: PD-(D/E)XK nuclease family protein [Candidatus Sungiibacteriota bacterium]|uniref:PD-(D/E)XK nuclease family protein n=1 Tax=Candidatus Sungiibacteriota bacterium TaxID=2750080 RepID=A0A7T5RJJ9_9BACT|nr:MAG: PD-(D/E)XK nuclease family protein [Candidatus Sungbacteria bacterium]